MAFAAAQLIEGPARPPLDYGLFSVAAPRTPGDPHWQNGVEWQSVTCGPVSGFNAECGTDGTVGVGLPKDFTEAMFTNAAASAFTVYAPLKCSPIGLSPERAQSLAQERLLAREEQAVERLIWYGINSDSEQVTTPALATGQDAETIYDGEIGGPIVALARAEQWLAETYGTQGVIHLSRAAATVLGQDGAIFPSSGALRTRLGTPVVAGSGYPFIEDNATAALAVSPTLLVYRSEIFTSSARAGDLLDRDTNDLYAVAERTYVVGWDDCGTGTLTFNLECC